MLLKCFGCFLIALPMLLCLNAAADEPWSAFRGDGSGLSKATNLPVQWSSDEGIAWKSTIPGYGQSAPVVRNGRVFITSVEGPFQQECQVHAFDLSSGQKEWTREIEGTTKVENYFRNSRAAPTCVVDNNAVYSFFASGDVTALNHEGKFLWTVPLVKTYGKVENERGIASSLAQTDDHVFVVVDHHGPSYIVAINKADGRIAWKTDRGDRVPSWSSPVIATIAKRDVVVVSSSDTVDCYDAASGATHWQVDGLRGNHIPSASVVGNRIYVGSTTMIGGESDPDEVAGSNCCIELTSDGDKLGFDVKWSAEKANSYYSTPLAFAGYVYYVNKVGVLYCVHGETGKQVFAKRIGNPCWASAIGVTREDGQQHVYFALKNGSTIVLRPGDEYDQIARNRLWDGEAMAEASEAAKVQRKLNAVPADQAKPKSGPEKVFAGMSESRLHAMFSYNDPVVYAVVPGPNCLLIRTGQHLYCIQ